MEFIVSIFAVVFLYALIRLFERVRHLEYTVQLLKRQYEQAGRVTAITDAVQEEGQSVETPLVPAAAFSPTPSQFIPATYRTPAVAPSAEFFLYTWFKEQTLIKVGALIFFLGAVWFVSYAISQGWIAESVRIMLGLLLALGIYGFGMWRKRYETTQYIVLTSLGTAVVLATVYSAQFFFQLFPAPVALGIIVLSIAYTVLVSVQTKTEWLAISAALAGFAAPFLIDASESDLVPFMLYLLTLSAGFLTVVFFTNWRYLSLVLVVGVSWFEWLAVVAAEPSDSLLWFFMILFAGLFLASTTVSLYRSAAPQAVDIGLLALVGLVYVYGAQNLSLLPGLALFVAAFLLAGIGYTLAGAAAPKRVVAVYICFSAAAWLIGTSLILSGFTQLLALTLEVTLAFMLLTELRLSERAVYLSVGTFAIPLVSSLAVFSSPAWAGGIWHVEALAATTVALSLIGSMLWVLHRPAIRAERFTMQVAGMLGTIGFLYTLMLLSRIADSAAASGGVFTYVLWTGFTFLSLYYVLETQRSYAWVVAVSSAFALPMLSSMQSLLSPMWRTSVLHPDAVGLYVIAAVSIFAALLYLVFYRQTNAAYLKTLVGITAISSLGYVGTLVWLVAHALIVSTSLAVMIALFVYTVSGLGMYIFGSGRSNNAVKYTGMALLALVVLRLGLVEVWTMDMIWRIVTFLGIGLLFMVAALLEKKPR